MTVMMSEVDRDVIILGFLSSGICAVVISLLFWFLQNRSRQKRYTFPFMKLPSEVRLIVFEHLVNSEDSSKTRKKEGRRTLKQKHSLGRILLPSFDTIIKSFVSQSKPNPLNCLTLVSRQVRNEFMQVFCQKGTFVFTLDASHTAHDSLWKVSPRILNTMRKCNLKILATPGIVGAFDPRLVSGRWELRDLVFELMEKMEHLTDLHLSIQACGNQLWNPIWLWHYTSQSFKESKLQAFRRISFDIEGWTMREPNHLSRTTEQDGWQWRCANEHFIQWDTAGSQPVREFCAALFPDCPTCDCSEDNIE